MKDIYIIFSNSVGKVEGVTIYKDENLVKERQEQFCNNEVIITYKNNEGYDCLKARIQAIAHITYLDDNIKKIIDFNIIRQEISLIEEFKIKYKLKNLNIHFDTLSINSINEKEIKVIISYSLDGKEYQEIEEIIPISNMRESFEKGFLFKNSEEIEKILKIKKI